MFEYENSPPPLQHLPSPSDRSRLSSREVTPVTPVVIGFVAEKSVEKHKDRISSWFKKQPLIDKSPAAPPPLETSLLVPNFDDNSFPLFGGSPPGTGMASAAIPRPNSSSQTSTSPGGNQPSHLTAALRSDGAGRNTMSGLAVESAKPVFMNSESSDMARFENGARPITVKGKQNEKQRRESLAQSMGMGMSWGGVSVGSWIRDDMMMSGTSPFAFHQSPSYHSSSYLPKLEANFMRDFSCCGMILPTLHDLLQHYEEAHAQRDPVQSDGTLQPPMPDSRAALATNTAAQIQQEAQQRAQNQRPQGGAVQPFSNSNTGRGSVFENTLQTIPDMDTVDDMEMDDMDENEESTPPPNLYTQATNHTSPPLQFSSTVQPQVPQLNTNMMQSHQAYRHSTPTTPNAGRNSATFQGANISSTLNQNPMQQFQDLQNPYRSTPDSSVPGTPGELDEALMDGMDDISMQNPLFNDINGFNNFNFGGMSSDMIDLCIDEPAKRLFTPGQGGGNQQAIHNRLGSGQYGANSDIAKRIREQQMLAGLPDTSSNLMPHEEPKPFRCPVIGCEKAYKNQNGLKYHKTHGHNNQRLHENGDGTFSIVNPDTQAPYPGTMGMEKEKPYKCDVCQKRYKNLNGLKYHKTHSPPCNPELQQQRIQIQQGQLPNQNSMSNMMSNQGMGLNMGSLGLGDSGDGNMM